MEILESMSDALYTLDEQWRITYVNRKTEELWDKRREDLLGQHIWTVFPQAVGTAACQACQRAMQERQSVSLEYFSPIIKRWLDVRAYPNGTGLVVHFSDITARKQAEAERSQQQEILQAIFDQIPVMIRLLDSDGRVQLVNRAWERTLGWSLAEVQQHNLALIEQLYLDPGEWQRALAFVAAATGEWADFRLRTRHGEVIDTTFANIRLTNGTNLSIGQDITARKRTEEALRTSEERFRRYFEMGLVGMAITSPTQTWLEVNDELCAIVGYERQELLQMTWAELTHPDDLTTDVSLFNQILAGEIDGYALDKRFIRKDGQVIHATIAVKCVRRADGTIEYFTGLLQDITARKAAEAAEREQHQFAAALRDSLAALTGSLTVERVMQQILEAAAIVVPSAAGSIILFEGEYGHVAYLRGFTPEAQAYFKDYRFPIAELANKHVPANKRPYFVPDTQTASDWIPLPVTAWIRSSIGIPITMRGEVIGLLMVDSDTANYFQPSDLEKLQAFAHYAGLALENAEHVNQLEQKVMARTAELNDAKERVEAILNNSPDGILLVHADLRIEQTNAAFHRLFASPPDDAYFGSLYDLIHTDDIARVQLVIETALQEQAGQPIEMRCYRKNGTLFDAELSISSITAAVTGTARFVCTIRDITERKQAQTALAEERNLLRTLIDTIPDYIYIKDTAHCTVLCNLAGARSVGMTPEETIGQNAFALFPAEMAKQFQADDDQLFQSGLPLLDHEELILAPGGKVVWGSSTKVPLHNLQGELIGLVGITRDISEHKQRERQLRYYASLQENVSDAVIASDLAFRIQSWNRAAETMYGWRAEEVIGQPVVEVLSTQYVSDEESNANALKSLLEQGYWQGEVVQRRKDGAALHILGSVTVLKDEQGLPFGVVAVNHNITERKRAAEALREQHDFLQLVINSVPDLITVNDRTGCFHIVNEHAAQIYGLTPAAMVGKTDAHVNANLGEVTFFLQTDQAALDSGQIVFIPEQTIQGRYYQTTKIPLKSSTEQPNRLLVVSSDITERKQAEAMLQQALQKEKELGELKSRFVSMASHEFRNPLTSILLLTDTLRNFRDKLSNDQIEERLGKIQAQGFYLRDIMEDVLQLTRLQAHRAQLNPVWLDLDALCRSVLDEFQSQANGAHRLLYTCDDDLGVVHLDKKLMRQLITNLVSNAMKYSAADTTIRISLAKSGEALVFQVQDQGIGIPAADLTYLFEPFHRAANVDAIAGTGLGLTIAKEAVELHGGTITVESQSGVGTTFTVYIPLISQS